MIQRRSPRMREVDRAYAIQDAIIAREYASPDPNGKTISSATKEQARLRSEMDAVWRSERHRQLPWKWRLIIAGVVLFCFVALVQSVLSYMAQGPVQFVVAAVFWGAVGYGMWRSLKAWTGRNRAGEDFTLPPREATPQAAVQSTVEAPLSRIEDAVVASLSGARKATYLAAVRAGRVPLGSVIRGDGFDYIDVPLLGGEVTPADVNDERFAMQYGVDPTRVKRVYQGTGALRLQVFDKAPGDVVAGRWPVLDHRGPWSCLDPVPVGVDPTGAVVGVESVEDGYGVQHMLFTGETGTGKTFNARMFLAAQLLDERTELRVVILKASKTLRPFKEHAAFYYEGGPGPEVTAQLKHVIEIIAERGRRGQSAADDGLVMFLIDEPQHLPKDDLRLLLRIVQTGRECGVQVIVTVQTPTKESLSQGTLSQLTLKFVGRLTVPEHAGRLLGTGPNRSACATLPNGSLFLVGNDPDPERLKAFHVDTETIVSFLGKVPARATRDTGVKVCPVCGTPVSERANYCGDACRKRASRDRKVTA